jgi:hypothetical protein
MMMVSTGTRQSAAQDLIVIQYPAKRSMRWRPRECNGTNTDLFKNTLNHLRTTNVMSASSRVVLVKFPAVHL